ncbi:hypothetical protein, partial [Nocardia africana]
MEQPNDRLGEFPTGRKNSAAQEPLNSTISSTPDTVNSSGTKSARRRGTIEPINHNAAHDGHGRKRVDKSAGRPGSQ